MGKLATAKRVLQTQGVAGLAPVFKHKLQGFVDFFKPWDNWLYGKLVELRGSIVHIDGCSFNVNSSVISTRLKSRFLFNNYETPEREALQLFLDPTLPVIELGGSVGVVACLTNRKLSNPGQHVVVEANPALVPLLEENRDRNKCGFTVLPRAYAYGRDYVLFHSNVTNFLGSSTLTYSDAEAIAGEVVNDVEVKTISLQAIMDQYGFDRCTLICDIEGGEAELVEHESALIRDKVATIIIEVHAGFIGEDTTRDMLVRLESLGFRSIFHKWDTYVFQKAGDNQA
jgi:FkbM family methyltransferase